MAPNSVPPPLALNTIANTSFESMDFDEVHIRNFISGNAGLLLDPGIRIRFWIISFLMFIMGVLHLITLIKNISIRNCWLVERNKSGYLNPNLEILFPLFALVNSSLVLSSIIMMNHDNGRYLSRPTMITQMTSYIALCYCAATRVWRTLSAIPLVPVQLTPHGTSLLSNGVPPFLFNTLVILLYISFPAATLPLTLKMTGEADRLGRMVFELVPELSFLIAQEQETPGAGLPSLVVEEVKHTLESIEETLFDVNRRWRISCGIYLFYCLGLFVLFIYASARLYSTLTVQLQILTQARRRFTRMASVGMIPFEDDLPHATESGWASTTYRNLVTSIKKLKAAILTQGQDQSECMKFWDCLDASGENAELERKAKMSSRYRTAVLWQSFCSTMIFMAFVVLTSCLAFNAFGVPYRTPATQVAIITFEWTGWAWSVPGSVLAFVTCGVALLPHSASEAATKASSSTSTRKQFAKDHRLQHKLSRTSTESDAVNLRPYGVFLTETHETSTVKTTIRGEIKTLSSKIWSKLSTHAGNSSALPVSQSGRKVSCLSLSEEEKISEHIVNEISPAHGIEIHPETARGAPCISRTPPFAPGHVILPMGQIGSDINIIKSLRHHPDP